MLQRNVIRITLLTISCNLLFLLNYISAAWQCAENLAGSGSQFSTELFKRPPNPYIQRAGAIRLWR
jgi:hypothetical protein